MKTDLTPGRLYAKIWREFRRVCCEKCAAGPLPIPTLAEEAHDRGQWTVGALQRNCTRCEKAYGEIVRRAQEKYDLFDPLSTPTPYWFTGPRAGTVSQPRH